MWSFTPAYGGHGWLRVVSDEFQALCHRAHDSAHGGPVEELRPTSLRRQILKPATRIDGRPADEPQCDEAALER
jgi:hypothetical protein